MPSYQWSELYNPNLRREKLEQVILFFINRVGNEWLGRTKLMKLLYFADFDHHEQFDDSITGSRYRALDRGPVPDDAWNVFEQMASTNRIRIERIPRPGYTQFRYLPVEAVDDSAFSAEELATLERVAKDWEFHDTESIVAASHGEAPWLAVKRNEEIPYHLVYYRNKFGEMGTDDDFEFEVTVPDEDEVFAR